MYTDKQIENAIAAEAIDWALFFKVTDAESIEARRQVMRANVSVGFYKPLLPYLRPRKEFLFISDRNPTATEEDRPYLARLLRGMRNRPDMYRVWRQNGEIRVQMRNCDDVTGCIRTKLEA